MTSVEKPCIKCNELWPDDKEFFFAGRGNSALLSVCKACYAEHYRTPESRRKPKRAAPSTCLPSAALQGIFHDLVAGAHA